MVAFSRPLKASTSIINLVDSDSDDPKKIAVGRVSFPEEDVSQLPARAELAPERKTRPVRSKRERVEKHNPGASLKRGHSLAVMWQPHEGHSVMM